ncbi:cilia- and flagella-associated protein 251-like isoform X2 [Maniola jurtina]|uniref:cilia- and flagella-associated protein 251-like isoform X2 n=1 Tax=Maniola jurtina TaxID=191418 RepID=UPI001E68BD7C|nr:cilia- and flagella-associated protein 251-like isoform X2 [Maniola jurtina]
MERVTSSKSLDKFHSLPNIRSSSQNELDFRRFYSVSLSHIRKRCENKGFGDYNNYKPSPFNLRWVHGYNPKVGVINLNVQGSSTAFYAAGNCAVLYNWTANHMKILQGHKHIVTCISSDSEGKWLVTADSGPENVIIIWDSSDYFPQKTIFNPHRNVKLAKVAMSADAKFLLTLGYQERATICWWIWSFGLDVPHASLEVEIPRGGVVDMGFNPSNTQQFLLMTKHDIWIGISAKIFIMERGLLKETDDYELKVQVPNKNITPDHGRLTCFTFVKDTAQVLVATSRGSVLVYGYTIEYKINVEDTNYENLKFIKVLKVEQRTINVIKSIDGVIVTGNSAGEIHFYDNQMKLLYWIHGFTVDSVKGLSFNISPRSYMILDPKCNKICPCWEKVVIEVDSETGLPRQKLMKQALPTDATASGKPLLVRDFIVCTHNEGVGFVDFVTEKLVTILDNKISHALALSVHPEKVCVCIGYADGTIELVNYIQHKLFRRIDLRDYYKVVIPPQEDSIKGEVEITRPQLSVTCLKYSPSGMHLACGLDTGQLIFLHPTTLNILTEKPHQDSLYAIIQFAYSCDSMTLALADKNRTVCVYKFDCETFKWRFVGKHRAHYKDITSVFFLPTKNDDGDYKLLSIGADRIMVEYDIGASSEECLEVLSLDRVDQSAVPLCGIPWANDTNLDPETHRNDLPMILIANDEYKYKIVNYATTMTLSTVLGPRYEHPVCRVQLVTRAKGEEEAQYLLFATKNIIGLQKMPLDGNPWKHTALLAHPVQILEMCYREDSGTLFKIGAKDNCMYQWAANYRSVDTTTKLGGGDLDPYYCLIENGRPGWLFHEIRDLFYYIQILCQGTFSPAMRQVKDYIPVDSLPDLMRALGYFPSEYEVENLVVEAKYKVYQRSPSSEIDFEEFVKLYLNHRPALGDNFRKIKNAFRHFAAMNNNKLTINRQEFIDMLRECFSRELSWYLLSILNGHSFEDRAAMVEGDFTFLPEEITLEELSSNILGIQELDALSEQYSNKESLGSQQTASSESEEAINF